MSGRQNELRRRDEEDELRTHVGPEHEPHRSSGESFEKEMNETCVWKPPKGKSMKDCKA